MYNAYEFRDYMNKLHNYKNKDYIYDINIKDYCVVDTKKMIIDNPHARKSVYIEFPPLYREIVIDLIVNLAVEEMNHLKSRYTYRRELAHLPRLSNSKINHILNTNSQYILENAQSLVKDYENQDLLEELTDGRNFPCLNEYIDVDVETLELFKNYNCTRIADIKIVYSNKIFCLNNYVNI